MNNILFLIVILASCAHLPPKNRSVDSRTLIHVINFKNEAMLRGVHIDTEKIHIEMEDERFFKNYPKSVGLCFKPSGVIILREKFWLNTNQFDHEQLVFHELGHCILGLGHVHEYIDIMNPVMVNSMIYVEFRETLLDRMFNRVRSEN